MPIPSTAPTAAPIIFMSTAADTIPYILPVEIIRWHLTSDVTSTWALQVTQSTSLAASTVGWPVIGTTTQSEFLGGSTGAGAAIAGHVDFWIHGWCYGLVLNVISGGFISVIKGGPSEEWVRMRPPGV